MFKISGLLLCIQIHHLFIRAAPFRGVWVGVVLVDVILVTLAGQ